MCGAPDGWMPEKTRSRARLGADLAGRAAVAVFEALIACLSSH
jgi:hypothetical protein